MVNMSNKRDISTSRNTAKAALMALLLVSYLLSCSSGIHHSQTGSIAVKLIFPSDSTSDTFSAMAIHESLLMERKISAAAGDTTCWECESAFFTISSANYEATTFGPFSYADRSAVVSGIPEGSGFSASASIRNVSGEALFAGSATGINVAADQVAPVSIILSYSKQWVQMNNSASDVGISSNSGDSCFASLALDASGNPVVAWQDSSSGNDEIYIKRWTGSAWDEIGAGSASGGGVSNNNGYSDWPSLALDSSGNPVVAWWDNSSGNAEIYIKRWTGSAWTEIGAGSASGWGISNSSGYSMDPSLALDSSGNPVVAWDDNSSAEGEIYIKRWDGSAWVEIGAGSASGGGISDNVGDSWYPSLALDSSGNPVVAWHDFSSLSWEIYVKRWNGSAWIEIGAGSASGGGISNNSGESGFPSLALDLAGNPVVAWQDNSPGNYEIYVRRWNPTGGVWEEMGDNSASGGGISNNSGESGLPAIAIDSSGNAVVAWDDNSSTNREIYIKRFNPIMGGWNEIGAGSASGVGVSNNSGESEIPSLAIDSFGNPVVAWDDNSSGNVEIYLRRWNGGH